MSAVTEGGGIQLSAGLRAGSRCGYLTGGRGYLTLSLAAGSLPGWLIHAKVPRT